MTIKHLEEIKAGGNSGAETGYPFCSDSLNGIYGRARVVQYLFSVHTVVSLLSICPW